MLFVILEAHQIWLANDLKLMQVSETQLSDGTGGGPRSQKNSSDIHRLHSHPLTDATSSLLPPPPSSPHADGLTRSESLQQMVRCESAAEWVEIGTGIALNISGVPEYNEDISEHVELHIKLVPRIIRNDKEDPLTGMPAPAPHPSVPEADGWM